MNEEAARVILPRLDRAAERGRTIQLWWRDDDAVRASPALDRLLALARSAAVPVAIAAIPSRVEPSLPARLRDEDGVTVLVHGWSHADHEPPGHKPAEFGPARPLAAMAEEAREGRRVSRERFGDRALPVFVPPWNRAAPGLIRALPELGYDALSGFGVASPGTAFLQLNTHIDPIHWRGGRGPVAAEALAAQLDRALAEPHPTVGLLTHHLAFDEPGWTLCARIIAAFAAHPAVRIRSIRDLIGEPERLQPRYPISTARAAAPARSASTLDAIP